MADRAFVRVTCSNHTYRCVQCRGGFHISGIRVVEGRQYCLKCRPYGHNPAEEIMAELRREREEWIRYKGH